MMKKHQSQRNHPIELNQLLHETIRKIGQGLGNSLIRRKEVLTLMMPLKINSTPFCLSLVVEQQFARAQPTITSAFHPHPFPERVTRPVHRYKTQ